MVVPMIRDTFPFRSHRSLAEVDETERLLERKRREGVELFNKSSTRWRLQALLARSVPFRSSHGRKARPMQREP